MTTTSFDLSAISQAIADFGLNGWLLYDFRGSNVLAQRVLQMDPDAHSSRRYAYYIPASGTPVKLVHRIEASALDHLPGEKIVYLKWQEWEEGIASLLSDAKQIAMEYSPRNANPYIARVDAGTLELVRERGVDVVSSGDLVQLFEATWTDEQWEMHRKAESLVGDGFLKAWKFIVDQVKQNGSVRETQVQNKLMEHFATCDLLTDHAPIVGVGPNSALPHYAPQSGSDGEIKEGDLVLIDAWAKMNRPDAVYADYTRMAFVGSEVPEQYSKVFAIVAAARDAGIACVRDAFASGTKLQGWQVDDATRQVIDDAGYGKYFRHRTGHNIGQETHGNGAHMDNLETHEDRRVLPRTCFSIEPGIYLEDFGIRSEINVYIDAQNQVHVTGDAQTEIRCLL